MKHKTIYVFAQVILLLLTLFVAVQLHKHYIELTTITEWNEVEGDIEQKNSIFDSSGKSPR